MDLGTFSVSLSVADLDESISFYKTLGFTQIAGEPENNWIILKNGYAHIGLFHGMFQGNLMTFNPQDARAIEAGVRKAGYKIDTSTEGDSGPAHFTLKDPDGNVILVDQHE